MKSCIFPLTFISLFALIAFGALRTPLSIRAALASTSQDLLQEAVRKQTPESCTVTNPPAHPFVPPPPYPNLASSTGFWFGTAKLWTQLPTDGTWMGLPHYRPTDTAFRQKLFWWREGYDWRVENPPKLTVTGKRLDSPAPPLGTDEHANAGWTGDSNHPFIVVGIDIPTLGCWKITGHFEDAELSFVIWVTK
jgi:hypothetical protein